MGRAIYGLVVLGASRKQAEQTMSQQVSKQHASVASAFRFLPELLPWVRDYKLSVTTAPQPRKFLLDMVFYHNSRNPN